MRLDHLSYAAGPEGLASCVQRIGARLGAGFNDGGLHPSFGTRNFVLPLADGCYLEIVDALDHPAVDRAPFGRAVRDRSAAGGGWLAWAVHVDDIGVYEERLGRPAAPGHRRRPDGFDLRWKQIGILDVAADPQLPFFAQWASEPEEHPGAGGSKVRLTRMEVAGDQPTVERWIGAPVEDVVGTAEVEWTSPFEGDRGLVAATFETPHGEVRID